MAERGDKGARPRRTVAGSGRQRRPGPGGRGEGRSASRSRRGDAPRRQEDRSPAQREYDGPPLPEDITGKELPASVRAQLKSLPDKLALRVSRHLAAAGRLLEADPETAYQHTRAALARAGRLAVVREAAGEAAYAAGHFAEALKELRAARRMNGALDYVAMMADCERALGRPDRALALARETPREKLSADQQAELVIVEAGARRDRGELDAALRLLERAPMMSRSRQPWVARLRYVYADTLVEAGREDEALTWFHRAEAVDGAGLTDAAQRAAQLADRGVGR